MHGKKTSIVIIGANDFQNRLIAKAKQQGYETHVFAWEDGATGKNTADFFYPISIVDKEKILMKCKDIQPVGVVSIASDLATSTVSYLTEHLSLCGNTEETTRVGSDKALMRRRFFEKKLPSPRYMVISENEFVTKNQAIDFSEFRFPLIVKPTDRSGSRGVTKILSVDEVQSALERAFEESFSKQAVIEEFVKGDEYSIEYISFAGIHRFIAATKKFVTGAPWFIEMGHLQPANLSQEATENIMRVVENALDALGMEYGASHTEVRITEEGKVYLIESGLRMGGDFIGSDLVPLTTGYDYVKMTIDIACGKVPDFKKMAREKFACVRFIFNREDSITVSECANQYPENIIELSLPDKFDSRIVSDSSARYGHSIFHAENQATINKILTLLSMQVQS